MGQQQLLLLVLGIVIVGLAVVVGIQAFGENQKKANADAITNDVIRIASDAQAWNLKPAAFGGGDGEFTDVGLVGLGYELGKGDANGTSYGNLNGSFSVTETGGTVTITGCNSSTGNQVVAEVDGTGPDDITTTQSNAATCANEA